MVRTDRHASPFSRLLAESMTGHLSRREIVKRAAALGVSAPLLTLLLKAQGVAAQEAADGERGATITVPENLRTDLDGAEISVIMGADGPVIGWEEAAIQKFQDATGITVNRISGPESATERLAQYQQLLGAQASDVDVMMIDVIWPGTLAQHAVDLTEAMESQGYEYFDRIVENNTVDDKLVGIPWFTDAGILYYRTDLLEENGFENPPETWQELTEMAQTIQEAQRGDNPDFWGFVWQGAAYEGLTCDALEWQASHGGGEIINRDLEVEVNNEATATAFELAKSWVDTISPPGVTTYAEEDARGVWQEGNAAFMRNWPYAYSLGQGDDSVIKDLFDVAILPMGSGPDARHADTLGGWQMMVSQYSENQEAAVEFAKYMTSREVQTSFAVEESRLPTIPELYDNEAVLEANPFFGRLRDVFLGGAVARPSSVTGDLYNEVSTSYFTTVNQILSDQVDVEDGLSELEEELEDIVSEI